MAETQLERVEAIAESWAEAFIVVARDATVTGWNPTAETRFGYAKAEILGSECALILGANGAARLRASLDRFESGGNAERLETFCRAKDGRRSKSSITIAPIRDQHDALLGASLVMRGAVRRRSTDAEKARFSAVLLGSAEPSDRSPVRAVLASWSAPTERLFGFADLETLGRDAAFLVPAELEAEFHEILERVRSGAEVDDCTWLRHVKAGHQIGTSTSLTPIRDGNKNVIGFLGVSRVVVSQTTEERERSDSVPSSSRRGAPNLSPDENPGAGTVQGLFEYLAELEGGEATGRSGSTPEEVPPKRTRGRAHRGGTHWQMMFDENPIPTSVLAPDRHPVWVNDAFVNMLGYSRAQLLKMRGFWEVTHPDELPLDEACYADIVAGRRNSWHRDRRHVHADGHLVPAHVFVGAARDESGAIVSYLVQAIDFTDHSRALQEVERASRISHLLFEQSSIPAGMLDLEGNLRLVNDALTQLLGFAREDLIGSPLLDHTHPDERKGQLKSFLEVARGTHDSYSVERRLLHADGHAVPGHMYVSSIRDDSGEVVALLGQFLDKTELWQVQEQLEYASFHDPLTSLPTRRLVADRVGREVEWARARHRFAGVAIVDIDRFDAVNETFGRALGDRLLAEFGQRLVGCTQRTDTVGRLEGDTFAVVRGAITDPLQMVDLAHEIRDTMDKPFLLDTEQEVVTVSIGVALSSRDETPERLRPQLVIATPL